MDSEVKEGIKSFIRRMQSQDIRIGIDAQGLKIEAPKGKVSQDTLRELKERKQELLAYFQQIHFTEDSIPTIEKSKDGYAISHSQKRLWVLSQFEEESLAYNLQNLIVLNGDYDIESFKKAIMASVERHEILRTVFRENEEEEIKQWVLPLEDLKFDIAIKDLRGVVDKMTTVNEYLQKDFYQAFDLENGPLIRASLFQLAENEYVFYYNMHHIISDAWSMNVLAQDVMTYYNAFVNQQPPKLPALKIQFKDYAAWQNKKVSSNEYEVHKSYWKNKLAGDLPHVNLPSERLRPQIKTNRGGQLSTYLSAALTQQFKQFCRKQEGSLFMGLLASWNVLLHKYTSLNDIILGTPVSGREHSDLENQIGFYVNTIALRNAPREELSFEQFFQEVKESTLADYAHQDYPFDQLVNDLNLKREMSRSAVFDIMLKLLDSDDQTANATLSNEEVEAIKPTHHSISKFDLNISFKEEGQYLNYNIVYNPDVYEEATVKALMKHFKQLLGELLNNSGESIGHLSYLAEEEKRKILEEWNATETSYSRSKSLVDLLEERVLETPQAPAFSDQHKTVSYQQLNEKANKIGSLLRSRGVGKGDYVAIHTNRNVEMVEAVLGVVKTGAAYVPFEPTVPTERKAYILNDLKVRVLLSDSTNLNLIQEMLPQLEFLEKVICLDSPNTKQKELKEDGRFYFPEDLEKEPSENLNITIDSLDEAYIIFTSGSTGTPKGVVVEHRPVINLIEWVNKEHAVSPEDKMLMVASISFDLSVYDIFGMIAAGGETRIVSYEEMKNPERLAEIIFEEGITFWDSAPAALSHIMPSILAAHREGKESRDFRLVFLSGDWIPLTLPKELKECFPELQVKALGGATEAVIWSNHYLVEDLDPNWVSIPYGKPISNAKYYILDASLQPCTIGVEGDLYIGGEVLAKEYKNDRELSAQKFINNPFAEGKMYRTGDRARFFKDGNIEFMGRQDSQVKIRGYRIELGDIKYAIEQHKDIKDALVTTKGLKSDRSLVAYFTSTKPVNISALRAFILKKLPEYMLPSYFIPLEEFPVSINGKVDRKKLPEPEEGALQQETEYIAPIDLLEEQLVNSWSTLLHFPKEKIGTQHNFFEIGGDSIKATRLISRVQKDHQVKLELGELYKDPNIQAVAAHIRSLLVLDQQVNRVVDESNKLTF